MKFIIHKDVDNGYEIPNAILWYGKVTDYFWGLQLRLPWIIYKEAYHFTLGDYTKLKHQLVFRISRKFKQPEVYSFEFIPIESAW